MDTKLPVMSTTDNDSQTESEAGSQIETDDGGHFGKTRSSSSSEDVPPDTVILHQFNRGPYAPSLSPFCVKLETYLRMAKIPYKNVMGLKAGAKGKIPWIELNGQSLADSNFCIEFLNKKFSVNLNQGLTATDLGIARAFRKMVDENLYWVVVLERWTYQASKAWLIEGNIPRLIRCFGPYFVNKQTKGHGMGRHSKEEVYRIMEGDMRALSDYLANKEFFMGREPTEVDCAIFGELSQFYYNMHGSLGQKLIIEELSNLGAYCDRMKERFWPDWEECCTIKGKPPTASRD